MQVLLALTPTPIKQLRTNLLQQKPLTDVD